jgi:hypothetical protein
MNQSSVIERPAPPAPPVLTIADILNGIPNPAPHRAFSDDEWRTIAALQSENRLTVRQMYDAFSAAGRLQEFITARQFGNALRAARLRLGIANKAPRHLRDE